MQEIKVSVIIPVYNVEKFLPQCLESCINQTLKEIEIICVNDGSTDGSLDIINSFAENDARIKVISKMNEGAGIARNLGVMNARGEYIIFVDGDDWLETDALSLLYEKIKKDNTDIVFFNVYNYFDSTQKRNIYKFADVYYSRYQERPFSIKTASDIIFDTNGLTFKIYKRKSWIQNDIKFSSHRFVEDSFPFFKYLLNADTASVLNKPIYNYRRHLSSSSLNSSKNIFDVFDVFKICEEELHKNDDYEIFVNSFVRNRIAQILYWYKFVEKSQKKAYFCKMKMCFKHILNKYGKNAISKSHYAERVKNIIKLPFLLEDIYFKLKTSWHLIKAQGI